MKTNHPWNDYSGILFYRVFVMNQKEWKNSEKYDGKYSWRNKARSIQKSLQYNQDPNASIIHHLRDTEEQRKYNDEHYEFWGFNQDGTFEYGKYVVFVTKEEHIEIHRCSEETRIKLGEASRKNWKNKEYRNKVIKGNIGKKLPESVKQFLREIHLGDKNPQYGKHPSKETSEKRSASLKEFYKDNEAARNHLREMNSGDKNAMYGKFGKDHPKSGVKLSDETKDKIRAAHKNMHRLFTMAVENGFELSYRDFKKLSNDDREKLAYQNSTLAISDSV